MARYRWAAERARGKRVLDLACGSGYGSAILRAGGARWVASADRAEEAFREAAQAGSRAGALRGTLADAARLPFRDASLDLYVSFETIEHVADDRAVVREARRVLAPGGVFVCSTPEREVISPGRTLADRPDNPYHEREYSRREFEALLRPEFDAIELVTGRRLVPRDTGGVLRRSRDSRRRRRARSAGSGTSSGSPPSANGATRPTGSRGRGAARKC